MRLRFCLSICGWCSRKWRSICCGTTAKTHLLHTMTLYFCMCWKMPSKSSCTLPIFTALTLLLLRRKLFKANATIITMWRIYPYIYPRHVAVAVIFVICLYVSRQSIHDASVLCWANPTLSGCSPTDDFTRISPEKFIFTFLATFPVIRCITVLPASVS